MAGRAQQLAADLPVGLALANTDEAEDLAADLPRLA
jgi:hypothetical protein